MDVLVHVHVTGLEDEIDERRAAYLHLTRLGYRQMHRMCIMITVKADA
jgi:hypothetical protein